MSIKHAEYIWASQDAEKYRQNLVPSDQFMAQCFEILSQILFFYMQNYIYTYSIAKKLDQIKMMTIRCLNLLGRGKYTILMLNTQ